MLTSEKTFSPAKTHGLSPTEADLTFRVAMGELAIVEQHCPIPLVADFRIVIVVQLLSNSAVSIGLQWLVTELDVYASEMRALRLLTQSKVGVFFATYSHALGTGHASFSTREKEPLVTFDQCGVVLDERCADTLKNTVTNHELYWCMCSGQLSVKWMW